MCQPWLFVCSANSIFQVYANIYEWSKSLKRYQELCYILLYVTKEGQKWCYFAILYLDRRDRGGFTFTTWRKSLLTWLNDAKSVLMHFSSADVCLSFWSTFDSIVAVELLMSSKSTQTDANFDSMSVIWKMAGVNFWSQKCPSTFL